MNSINVVFVGLYRFQNFPIRIMHSLLEDIDGIYPHAIFYKNCLSNQFELPTEKEEELFLRKIIDLQPDFVCLSVLSPFVPVAKRITKVIKDNTSAKVIWGGIHPTISPEDSIIEADMICVGEGEEALSELVTFMRDGKNYFQIKNLWINSSEGIIRNPMRPLIQDLDSLPFPSYGKETFFFIESNKLTSYDSELFSEYLWVQTSRGCPFVCSYCVNSLLRPLFKDLGGYSRRRSVDNVIREIDRSMDLSHGAKKFVFFADEVFGNDKKWLDEFVLKYKKNVGLPFYAEYNPKLINSEMLRKLTGAGLDTINFGIQTGSDYIRNEIFQRPGKNTELIALAQKIAEFGIKIKYDLILDNPYDTEETLVGTIDLLLQLPKPLCLHLYSFQYFPHYPFTKRAIKDGHIQEEDADPDVLYNRTTEGWIFKPRIFPLKKEQSLQNVIWLISMNKVDDSLVKFAVHHNSVGSRLCFVGLYVKSIILGKMFGVGGLIWKYAVMRYLIKGMSYLLKGDFHSLSSKITKIFKRDLLIKKRED